MDFGNITGKAEKHAEVLAFIAGSWERMGSLGGVLNQFTHPNEGLFFEIKKAMRDWSYFEYKLLYADHLYTATFKAGALMWAANWLGFIGPKWGNIGKKVALGSAGAALTMYGSGGTSGGNHNSSSSGIKGY